jgi:hypothetical protein
MNKIGWDIKLFIAFAMLTPILAIIAGLLIEIIKGK